MPEDNSETNEFNESLRFYMSPVSGNTMMYSYPMEVAETPEDGKYFTMKGGFYQGFFKLHEMDYQTLPYFIEDEWNMSFRIRPRHYEVGVDTLNHLHEENNGIFFYMGTRAENKFWELYNNAEDKAEFLVGGYGDDSYIEGWDPQNHVTEYVDYLERELDGGDIDYSTLVDGYSIEPDYWEKDIDLSEIEVLTSLGYELDKWGYYEIQTDNKFVFFNRTCTGFTVNNWDLEENDYTYNACKNKITPTDHEAPLIGLTGITSSCKENKFITYNRTCTGKTVHHIHRGCYHNYDGKGKKGTKDWESEYGVYEYQPYDIYKDIRDNSFALRVDPKTGAIGYRFGMLDCDEPLHHYSVKEEYSKPGLVPYDQWTDIHVKFKILNPTYRDCITHDEFGNKIVKKIPTHVGERKMKIYIYVNGYLVFISQELKEFRFRALNDVYQKQEGVPFSMSLGGGTQGLLETISKDYHHISEYCLPIEKNFAGTFLGDIKYFRFYDCFMDLPTIRRKRLFIV